MQAGVWTSGMCGRALSLESCSRARRDRVLTGAAGTAPATCGAAQPRDCSASHGKPLTAVGTAGKAQIPRPGAAAMNALGFGFSRAGAELRHPPARSCGVRRGSPRTPNPGVGTSAWKSPDPRELPGLGAAGSGGRSHGNAPSIPRSPRQRPAIPIPHPPCTSLAWPGPPRLSRWTVNAGEAAPLPTPSPVPVVKSVCNPPPPLPRGERRAGHG